MNDRWKDVDAIVDRALSADPIERPTIIAQACAGDAELRREVESLLKACEAAGGFLERPALALDANAAEGAADEIPIPLPERIAGFRIQRVLGVGGMGVVYVAEQERPRRTVALKVIKPGLATPSVLRRFEHEAEVLGRLHHPGIAQVYEAGTAEGPNGPQPFFAMELIDGQPITSFAVDHHLKIRERLELLARVCDAVQHAHQQGVIHRDLKPSNILVDPTGQPKVLDFGVARVSRSDGSAPTLQTHAGQIIGTLAYMSPEQASGDSAAIDTRSDIYALGVVGYQLLSGKLPLDIGNRPLHEDVRAVHEEDPAPLGSVDTALRGDIDTVIGKALHKNKVRRYQTAAEFGSDLRRYLADEPVLARPPSVYYQLTKFAKRHRVLVVGATAITLAVTAGLVVSLVAAARLRSAALRESQLRQDAEIRRSEADSALAFITRVLQSSDSSRGGSPEIKVVDLLSQAESTVDTSFANAPAAAATVHLILGQTFQNLGRLDTADRHIQASLSIRRQHLADRKEDVLAAADALVRLREHQGRLDEARELQEALVDDAAGVFGLGSDPAALARLRLAVIANSQGHYEEAMGVLQKLLAERLASHAEPDAIDLSVQFFLASNLQMIGRLGEAEALFRKVASSRCPPSTRIANPVDAATESLAQVLSQAGKDEEAIVALKDLIGRRVADFGPDDLRTLNTKLRVVEIHRVAGRLGEAANVMKEIVDSKRRRLGDRHPEVLSARMTLCGLELPGQDTATAVKTVQDLRRVLVDAVGDADLLVYDADQMLASALERDGQPAIALTTIQTLLARQRASLGPKHPQTMYSRELEAAMLIRAGRLELAESLYQNLIVDSKAVYGDGSDWALMDEGQYGAVLMLRGNYTAAEAPMRHAFEGLRARYGESHPWVKARATGLVELQTRQNRIRGDTDPPSPK